MRRSCFATLYDSLYLSSGFSEAADLGSQISAELLTQRSSGISQQHGKDSDSDYAPSSQASVDSLVKGLLVEEKLKLQKQTMNMMLNHSQLFMGVQPKFKFLLEIIAEEIGDTKSLMKTYVTLRKIRLNEPFELIALYFGISTSFASDIFTSVVPTISACLAEFVFDVSKTATLRNLPVAFRTNYSLVSHTLDCFEIQIQTPSNAKHRAITYSSYKCCNTLKYLISVTPDGFCNYISRGYGGRCSDTGLTNDCGLLNHLARDSTVLADRGFKALESYLDTVGVSLQRPPSVYAGKPLSKNDCQKGRQIASVRIHVERFIGRLRAFQFISPHATVPVKLIPYIDFCVIIACALTNLGVPLIKGNECS